MFNLIKVFPSSAIHENMLNQYLDVGGWMQVYINEGKLSRQNPKLMSVKPLDFMCHFPTVFKDGMNGFKQ